MSVSGDENANLIVMLRGLPWTVTVKDIIDFLQGVEIADGQYGVHIVTFSKKHKRPNGEAFIECASEEDYKHAFTFDKKNMGNRYIEVLSVKQKAFEVAMRQMKGVEFDSIVRLRGLPWGISEKDVEKFFDGLEIKQTNESGESGIRIVLDRFGRASGEAYVQFNTKEDSEKALKRNLEKIGNRYIEIFRSSKAERSHAFSNTGARPKPYDKSERGGKLPSLLDCDFSNMKGFRRDNRGNDDMWSNNQNNNFGFGNTNFGRNFDDGFGFGNGNGNNNGNFGNGNGNFNFNNSGGGDGRNFRGFGNGNMTDGGGMTLGNMSNENSMGVGNMSSNFGLGNENIGNITSDTSITKNDNVGSGNIRQGGSMGGGSTCSGSMTGNMGSSNLNGNNMFGGTGYGSGMSNRPTGTGSTGYGALNTLGFGGLTSGNLGNNFSGGNFANNNFSDGNFGGRNNDVKRNTANETYCVRLRGLPYSSNEDDINKFFEPLKPIHCKIMYNKRGLHSGEASAYFETNDEALQALKRDREKIGSRYIELFYENSPSNRKRNF